MTSTWGEERKMTAHSLFEEIVCDSDVRRIVWVT